MRRLTGFVAAAVLFSSLFVCSYVFPFQFEGYEWGTSLDYLYDTLKDKKQNVGKGDNYITLDDAILDRPCQVILYFTPKSKQLAKILIQWQQEGYDRELKDRVIEQYGPPNSEDNLALRYTWVEGPYLDDDKIELIDNEGAPVQLIYYDGEYWRKFQEEQKGMNQGEAGNG